MEEARWYPHGFLIPGNELLVLGHNKTAGQQSQDRFDTGAPSWTSPLLPNKSDPGGCTGSLVNVKTYPRAHVLAFQETLFLNDLRPLIAKDLFLDLIGTCPTVSDRWQTQSAFGVVGHEAGTSVHIVTYDELGFAHDAIYYIGGNDNNGITDAVNRIEDPALAVGWTTAPSLNYPREDLNCVILADGSILVVGGHSEELNGDPIPRHRAERYKPVENFGGAYSWELMAAQEADRLYHSVAGLLPDGTVFSAGGDDEGTTEDSPHSIEVYKPPYLFWGPRPVVSGVASTWNYGPNVTFTVTTRNSIIRVGLIRFGSVTHGFDSDQRYVSLPVLSDLETSPGVRSVTVTTPLDEYNAPEGDYMLFVVDSSNVPSVATIVRMN